MNDYFSKKNYLTAAFATIFIPGLGQLFKGNSLAGSLWVSSIFISYYFFIPLGILLHLFCVLDAGVNPRIKPKIKNEHLGRTLFLLLVILLFLYFSYSKEVL